MNKEPEIYFVEGGLQLHTECVRTDFIENPGAPSGEVSFTQNKKNSAHITLGTECGVISIRDMASGVMLSVPFIDMAEMIKACFEMAAMTETDKKEAE